MGSRLQPQEIEQQQRQLIFQQEQHLREQQILNQRLPQDQQQVQQRQLRQQIHHLMELELPQNNQLIDSLTEKTYEIALICTNSKCARDFVFDRMKVGDYQSHRVIYGCIHCKNGESTDTRNHRS